MIPLFCYLLCWYSSCSILASMLYQDSNQNSKCDLFYNTSKIAFDYEVDGKCANFYNQSIGNYSKVEWHFGDGNLAEGNQTSHSYDSEGIYLFKVVLKNEHTGCQKKFEGKIYIIDY